MIRSAIRHLERLHDGLRQTEQIYMVLVATLIGLLGGLGAVGSNSRPTRSDRYDGIDAPRDLLSSTSRVSKSAGTSPGSRCIGSR